MTDETKPTVTAPGQIWAWASFDDDGDWYNANARDVGDTGGQQYIRADIHHDAIARLTAERDALYTRLDRAMPHDETGLTQLFKPVMFWHPETRAATTEWKIYRLYRLAVTADALIATMSGGDPDLRKAYEAIK